MNWKSYLFPTLLVIIAINVLAYTLWEVPLGTATLVTFLYVCLIVWEGRFSFGVNFIISVSLLTTHFFLDQTNPAILNIFVRSAAVLCFSLIFLKALHVRGIDIVWFYVNLIAYSFSIWLVFYVGGNEAALLSAAFGVMVYGIFLKRFYVLLNFEAEQQGHDSIYHFTMSIVDIVALIFFFASIYNVLGIRIDGIETKGDMYSSVFFSFVTWTTLGYGDMTPVGVSRLFAAIEAFSGMLAMALLISGIVVVYQVTHEINTRKKKTKNDKRII